jgi:hypothetical protein
MQFPKSGQFNVFLETPFPPVFDVLQNMPGDIGPVSHPANSTHDPSGSYTPELKEFLQIQ